MSTGASAEVVAQDLVSLVDGDYHFRLSTAAISQSPTGVELVEPTFLLAGGRPLCSYRSRTVPAGAWPRARAVYRPGGSAVEVGALETGAASLTTMTNAQEDDVNTFAPGAGVRDVDLVRIALPTDGSVTTPTQVARFALINLTSRDLGTNPSDEDTDDDGALDGDEFRAGTDPNDPAAKP